MEAAKREEMKDRMVHHHALSIMFAGILDASVPGSSGSFKQIEGAFMVMIDELLDLTDEERASIKDRTIEKVPELVKAFGEFRSAAQASNDVLSSALAGAAIHKAQGRN